MIHFLLFTAFLHDVSAQSASQDNDTTTFPPTQTNPPTTSQPNTPTGSFPTTPSHTDAPSDEDREPVNDISSTVVWTGKDTVVVCGGKSSSLPRWEKDGVARPDYTANVISVHGDKSSAGMYQCFKGNDTYTTTVFVEGDTPVSTELSNDTTRIIPIILRAGDMLSINLTLDVYPLKYINITGSFINVIDDISMATASQSTDITGDTQLVDNILKFNVKSVSWDKHNGYYTFELKYAHFTRSVMFLVTVQEPAAIQSFQGLPPFVEAGTTVRIVGVVSGHPPPLLHWYYTACCYRNNTVYINDAVLEDKYRELFSIEGQSLLLQGDGSNEVHLNGTYWFEVEQMLISNLTSPRTRYVTMGWGIGLDSENLTVYQNEDVFDMTCSITNSSAALAQSFAISLVRNGEEIQSKSGSNITSLVYNVSASKESEGIYQCIARTDNFTLRSRNVKLNFVPQPVFTVTPKVFKVVEGSDAIFSCGASGVSKGSPVTFWVSSSKKDKPKPVHPTFDEPELLYLKKVEQHHTVSCNTTHKHPNPIYSKSFTKLVETPVVTMKSSISDAPIRSKGETFVLRCEIESVLLGSEVYEVFWKHQMNRYDFRGTQDNVHIYDNGVIGNTTTSILVIQDLDHKKHNGTYTCVFVSDISGRYEKSIDVFVRRGLTRNVLAIIIGVSLVVLILLLIVISVALARAKNKRTTGDCLDLDRAAAPTNNLVDNEVPPAQDDDEVSTVL